MIKAYHHFPKSLQVYIPNFEYLLFDFSHQSNEEIKGNAVLEIYTTLVKAISNPYESNLLHAIFRAIDYLNELESKEKGIEYLETIMRYILSAAEDLSSDNMDTFKAYIEDKFPEGSDIVMTMAEQYMEKGKAKGKAEGIAEGKAEGIAEGKAEALVNTAIKLLSQKFGNLPNDISEQISIADEATLQRIIEDIFQYEKLDDVKKYL